MANKYEDIPVFVFSCGERTVDFCMYCLDRIGFNNVIKIENDLPFYKKLIQFSDAAYDMQSDFYVRLDADMFVFSGIMDLIEITEKQNLDGSEGLYFDFLMNKVRHGTPHIYSNSLISKMKSGQVQVLNNNKPESHIMKQVANKKPFRIVTNLHDYEQYPSKIINTLINRLYRNHSHHYDWNRLRSIGFTKEIDEVFNYYNNNKVKSDCNYVTDFNKFDEGCSPIDPQDFSAMYDKYVEIYNKVVTHSNGVNS